MRNRFAHPRDDESHRNQPREEYQVTQAERPGCVLREQSARQGSQAEPDEIRAGGDRGALLAVLLRMQLRDPRGGRACDETDGETGQEARRKEEGNGDPRDEDHHAGRREGEARERRGPPSDLVGDPADEEQRGQCPCHVRRVDEREGDFREPQLGLIEIVERRRQRAAGEDEPEDGSGDPHPGCPGDLAVSHWFSPARGRSGARIVTVPSRIESSPGCPASV